MPPNNLTLEEKIDLLLDYHMKAEKRARLKTILQLITLLAIFLLPVILFVTARSYLQNVIGLSMEEIGALLRKARILSDFGGVEGIKNLISK